MEPKGDAWHHLNGGNIFREMTFRDAVELINGQRTDWPYAEHTARIAITAATNDLGVYEAAQLLGYYNDESEITETDEDIFALSEWLIEGFGWNSTCNRPEGL